MGIGQQSALARPTCTALAAMAAKSRNHRPRDRTSIRSRGGGGGSGGTPVFGLDLNGSSTGAGSIIPASGSATPTFTRATTATVRDWETVIRSAQSGEARFYGMRRVRNFLALSEAFESWTKLTSGTGAVAVITTGQTDPLGGTSARRVVLNRGASNTNGDYSGISDAATLTATGTYSLWVKSNTASSQNFGWAASGAGTVYSIGIATTSWQRLGQISKTLSGDAFVIVTRGAPIGAGIDQSLD